jgi:hypothetical protein
LRAYFVADGSDDFTQQAGAIFDAAAVAIEAVVAVAVDELVCRHVSRLAGTRAREGAIATR